jgi:hypothetical protein
LFSEADFVCVFAVTDKRDYKLIEGFVPAELGAPLPWHHWRWWDRKRRVILNMSPVPPPDVIAAQLADRAPYTPNAWHPFAWTARTSVREPIRLH